jgi:N-acetylglucosamine-6-phosphate deacetylase
VRITGRIVTPTGVVEGDLVLEDGIVAAIERRAAAPPRWVAPGFIDLQINGAHGIDVTRQPSASPSSRPAPRAGCDGVPADGHHVPGRRARRGPRRRRRAGARPVRCRSGLHLEGPMLSPVRKGAHPSGTGEPVTVADRRVVARCRRVRWRRSRPSCQAPST